MTNVQCRTSNVERPMLFTSTFFVDMFSIHFAVRTRIELVATDRQSVMLAITPTNRANIECRTSNVQSLFTCSTFLHHLNPNSAGCLTSISASESSSMTSFCFPTASSNANRKRIINMVIKNFISFFFRLSILHR
jgi:hypothetical protein